MRNYEVEPLVSIQGEGIVNTFYPSRIDNSKIFVGCQSNLDVLSIDSEWKFKREVIKLAKEKRRERPYPIKYLMPHPNEMYTVATAGLNGNVVIWDVNYDKQVKTCSIMSLHTSTCQGIDWNRSNTNLLIACFQDGRISLWDRRTNKIANEWSISTGAHGVSFIRFDPFHDSLFSCICEDTTLCLFDMASSQPLLKQTNDSNNSFLTIHYNPYKPNLMAASCSNHTIQLFNTNSHTLSNFFSTLPPSHDHPLPTAIETEFEVRDISWNPQNPYRLAACGIADGSGIYVWDVRSPYS
ncbi:hypothetical protein WA588_004983 [Blastocystis sp. NMH]